jgi:hypothetical protein
VIIAHPRFWPPPLPHSRGRDAIWVYIIITTL